jgi:hypothetical protein
MLFADDLGSLFYFNKGTKSMVFIINKYLKELAEWLNKWGLIMNTQKCCYTIFANSGYKKEKLNLLLNNSCIPYNKNPIFLGITFDEQLCFNLHFENLRARALKRLNIIKIFSHQSWKLNYVTLKTIYRCLVGSIFDYSFFTLSKVSDTVLNSVQRVQNRAIRCIYKLPWDSPTELLFPISNINSIGSRFLQLGCRYLAKCLVWNPLVKSLTAEYIASRSSINRNSKLVTPLCFITYCFSLACAVLTWLGFYILVLSM